MHERVVAPTECARRLAVERLVARQEMLYEVGRLVARLEVLYEVERLTADECYSSCSQLFSDQRIY